MKVTQTTTELTVDLVKKICFTSPVSYRVAADLLGLHDGQNTDEETKSAQSHPTDTTAASDVESMMEVS